MRDTEFEKFTLKQISCGFRKKSFQIGPLQQQKILLQIFGTFPSSCLSDEEKQLTIMLSYSESHLRGLMHSLISEGTGTADNANTALLVNVPGHNSCTTTWNRLDNNTLIISSRVVDPD
jgi:hypothetical protein